MDISVGTNFLSEVIRDMHERAKVCNSLYCTLADNDFTVTEALGSPNGTFRVGFPIAQSLATSYALDETALLLDEKAPFQPLRLLIVDDNPNSLKSISSACSVLGHSVANAVNEALAVSAIITGQFDLVLLDTDLANRASARILDSIPDHLLTPIVLMSATGQHGTLMDQPRVHSVLMKPFSTATLASTLLRIPPFGGGSMRPSRPKNNELGVRCQPPSARCPAAAANRKVKRWLAQSSCAGSQS